MRGILIVDEDLELREALAVPIRRLFSDADVRTTGDGVDAMLMVDGLSLLITAEDTPLVDGLMVAACARRDQPDVPVIFLSDHPRSNPAFERGNMEWLPRRPRLDRFLGTVERMLKNRERQKETTGFRGEIEQQTFLELLRTIAGGSASGALKVRTTGGSGTVWFELGTLVHAVCDEQKGTEALRRMLGWRGGQFTFARQRGAPERSLRIPATDLVRECARIVDQYRSLARGSNPGLNAMAAKHFLRGLELVKFRRFDEALHEWEQASRLDDENVSYREHLVQLREQLQVEKGD